MTKISHAITGVHTQMTGTDSFMPPRGTTAQRPTLTANEAGAIRSNSTLERIERYNGTSFRQVGIHGHFNSSHLADFSITTAVQAVPFNTNDIDSGTSISHSTTVNNSRFTINDAGTYEFIFQPQVASLGNNTSNVYFWMRKNGTTAIANSGISYKVNHTGSSSVIVGAIITSLVANDYIEIMAQAGVNGEYLLDYIAGSGSGSTERPSVPSCIVSIKGW